MAFASITFGQVLLTVLEIALLGLWIWVAASVVIDILRSPDLSSAAKAGWMFLVILIPLLGVLIYVVARGDKMKEHELVANMEDDAGRAEEEFQRVQKGAREAASAQRDPSSAGSRA